MAFDITYTDFNGSETKILIYKGTEGGTVNDYVTRVEADVISEEYPDAQYEMNSIDTITANAGVGKNTYLYEGSDITTDYHVNWSDSTNWYFQFTIDGVVQHLVRYNYDFLGTGLVDVSEGYFTTNVNTLATTDELQLAIYDADGNNNFTLLDSVVVGRDTVKVYNYDVTPISITPNLEGLDCLKYKVGVLAGESHSFCGTDNPLKYKYYSDNKYSNILASEIEIGVLIKDASDHTAMKNILNGGYYVAIYKDNVPKWLGKLTSRFYTEAYAQYPYAISLSGSDQLGSFERYQPLMIDFPKPNGITSIIELLGKFLMDDSMYGKKYAGDKIRTLYFSSRFLKTFSVSSKIETEFYLDPLNWMEDDTQYKSKKDILTDVLKAFHAKIFQWDYKWYVMDFEAQWNAGAITWNTYTFTDGGDILEGAPIIESADFVYPYVSNPSDRQVYNNAEMRYEPSWRKLEMNLNYNECKEDIDGFTNILGNFYKGHDGVNLEFNNDNDLRYWSGDNIIHNHNGANPLDGNNGWAYTSSRATADLFQYIDTVIQVDEYNQFSFDVTLEGLRDVDTARLAIEVSILQNGVRTYLNNEDGDSSDYVWDDDYSSITLIGNQSHSITIGYPTFDTVATSISLRIGIYSFTLPRGQSGDVLIKGLKANFINNEWESVNYNQVLDKPMSSTEADTQITKIDYDWGLYHDVLPNENQYHRSGVYYEDGSPVSSISRSGEVANISIMDWIGNIMIGDNTKYTPTLTASYFSQLTPLSLMVGAEGEIYRFVSGEFNDKISTWRNVYTKFKAIKNIPTLTERGDYSTLDYDLDDYYVTSLAGYVTHEGEYVTHNSVKITN